MWPIRSPRRTCASSWSRTELRRAGDQASHSAGSTIVATARRRRTASDVGADEQAWRRAESETIGHFQERCLPGGGIQWRCAAHNVADRERGPAEGGGDDECDHRPQREDHLTGEGSGFDGSAHPTHGGRGAAIVAGAAGTWAGALVVDAAGRSARSNAAVVLATGAALGNATGTATSVATAGGGRNAERERRPRGQGRDEEECAERDQPHEVAGASGCAVHLAGDRDRGDQDDRRFGEQHGEIAAPGREAARKACRQRLEDGR